VAFARCLLTAVRISFGEDAIVVFFFRAAEAAF
jgi:hypothetical protein